MMNVVGQTCPFCQFPIKPGEEHVICSACGIVHHKNCWNENGSKCTTFGCQGTTAGGQQHNAPSHGAAQQMQPCPYCGKGNSAGSMFCSQCGRNLAQAQAAATMHTAAYPAQPYGMPQASGLQGPYAIAQYPKAPLGSRLGAHIIDGLITGGPMVPGFIFMAGRSTEGLGILLLVVAWIWAMWYGFTKDGMPGGQSYGKQMCGLMVVHLLTNQPCTKGKSFLRQLSYLIPYVGGIIEIVMVLANDKGHRLGDMLAGTQVISADQYRTY